MSALAQERSEFRRATAPAPLFIAILAFVCAAVSLQAQTRSLGARVARMSYLDDGEIRLGVDLNLGGAITFLSRSGTNKELNLINSHDLGRMVQYSFYSGPVPFQPPGARLAQEWAGLGWNPVQAGDSFNHASRVLEFTNTGNSIYVKSIPMLWPLDNVPAECECETWLLLEGPVVKAHCRLLNRRSDHAQSVARPQELPAVYVNGAFSRLMTYKGEEPFSGGPLSQIIKRPGEPGYWTRWTATENWAALVNNDGWGLGVWNPDAFEFDGGVTGTPGSGGPADSAAGYIGPLRSEVLDHNIVYDCRYQLIVGTLEDIRNHVYMRANLSKPVAFTFENDRQGWTYFDASDAGWPIRGELDISAEGRDPQVISPVFFARCEDTPKLTFDAAFETRTTMAAVYWRGLGQEFDESRSKEFEIWPDGKFHRFEINLGALASYKGTVTQIRIDPVPAGHKGARFRLKSAALGK